MVEVGEGRGERGEERKENGEWRLESGDRGAGDAGGDGDRFLLSML